MGMGADAMVMPMSWRYPAPQMAKAFLRVVVGCRVIHTFMPKILDNFRFSSGSNVGRGGMEAKVASAWDAAQSGVTTVIANGKLPSVLLRVGLAWLVK